MVGSIIVTRRGGPTTQPAQILEAARRCVERLAEDAPALVGRHTRARGIMEFDILGSAENFTLTVSRLPEGKFSVRSGTSQIETVILADQVLAAAFRPEAG